MYCYYSYLSFGSQWPPCPFLTKFPVLQGRWVPWGICLFSSEKTSSYFVGAVGRPLLHYTRRSFLYIILFTLPGRAGGCHYAKATQLKKDVVILITTSFQTVKKGQSSRETLPSSVGAGYIRPAKGGLTTMFLVWQCTTGRRGRRPLQTRIEVFRHADPPHWRVSQKTN